MKKILKRFAAGVALFVFMAGGCRNEPIIPQSPEMSFSTDIQPILGSNCQMEGCHGNQGGGGEEEAEPLVTYDDVMENGGIMPYDAHNSNLYEKVIGAGGEIMPPAPYNRLSQQQLLKIYLWIMQGAKNN